MKRPVLILKPEPLVNVQFVKRFARVIETILHVCQYC